MIDTKKKMNENTDKTDTISKPYFPQSIPVLENTDLDEEVNSEDHANRVHKSPVFKNSLIISKGSPRKGFKVEDLPEVCWFGSSKEIRSISFKVHPWLKQTIDKEITDSHPKHKIYFYFNIKYPISKIYYKSERILP